MRKTLQSLRKQHGWTQAETAKRLGITERAYRFIEHGDRNPSFELMNRMEDLFKSPQRELLVQDNTSVKKD